jgi:hypothetical protein
LRAPESPPGCGGEEQTPNAPISSKTPSVRQPLPLYPTDSAITTDARKVFCKFKFQQILLYAQGNCNSAEENKMFCETILYTVTFGYGAALK